MAPVRRSTTPPEATSSALARAVFEEMSRRIIREGQKPDETDLQDLRRAGAAAAEQGMSARGTVDLYLESAAHAWRQIPPRQNNNAQSAAQTLLDGIRAAVPMLVEGYQNAGQQLIRQEEAERREFIDDLLRGDAHAAGIAQRAEPFGIDLTASHQIVLAELRNHSAPEDRDEAEAQQVAESLSDSEGSA